MHYNKDPRTAIFLFGLMVIFIGIYYLIKFLSDRFLYKYLDSFKSNFIIKVLVVLQWSTAIGVSLWLPDYLIKYNFFQQLFENSEFWNYIVTLCVFFISLITISAILNLLFCRANKEENTYLKQGVR